MTYGTFVKTATRGAEPSDCSGWGELHDDTAWRTAAREVTRPQRHMKRVHTRSSRVGDHEEEVGEYRTCWGSFAASKSDWCHLIGAPFIKRPGPPSRRSAERRNRAR